MHGPAGAGPVATAVHDRRFWQQVSLQPQVDRRTHAFRSLADLLGGRPLGGAAAAFGHVGGSLPRA